MGHQLELDRARASQELQGGRRGHLMLTQTAAGWGVVNQPTFPWF